MPFDMSPKEQVRVEPEMEHMASPVPPSMVHETPFGRGLVTTMPDDRKRGRWAGRPSVGAGPVSGVREIRQGPRLER